MIKNKAIAIFSMALLGCSFFTASQDMKLSELCVVPSSTVDELIANCDKIKRVMQNTEEGPRLAYEIIGNKYRYIAEIDSNRVSLLRFMNNPLPMNDLAVGNTFATVKARRPGYMLKAGAEEGGYISLADPARGIYLSFNTSQVPTDWYFAKKYDELAIEKISLESVNYIGPKESEKGRE